MRGREYESGIECLYEVGICVGDCVCIHVCVNTASCAHIPYINNAITTYSIYCMLSTCYPMFYIHM